MSFQIARIGVAAAKLVVDPVNTVAPVASGTISIGNTLNVTTGTWTGVPAPTFTYQWKRDGVDIGGATANSHVVVAADVGPQITCRVTGTNAGGAVGANSNALVYSPSVFTPSIWLEGDDPTINFSGFTWPNPGSGNDFTAASNKPTARTEFGKQAVDFNGTNTSAVGGLVSNYFVSTSWFVAGVAKLDTNRTAATVKDWTAAPIFVDDNAAVGVLAWYNGSAMELFGEQFTGGGLKVTPSNADLIITTGSLFYFEAYYDSALNRMGVRLNGGADRQTAAPGSLFAVNGAVRLGFSSFSLAGFDGAICSLWGKAAQPTAGQLADYRAYSTYRWGVTTP